MQVQTRGEFGGLGIEVTQENGYIKVVSPIDDTPAARAGVKAGDLITELDGKTVQGLTPATRRSSRCAAPPGTQHQADHPARGRRPAGRGVADARGDPHQVVRSRLERRHRLHPADRLQRADRCRPAQGAHRRCKQQAGGKLKGLVLDLRNNPGGLLDQAVRSRTTSSTRARSSPPAPATRGRQRWNAKPGDIAAGPAGGGADQRRLGLGAARSSPAPCRTIAARSCSAPAASARARCRRSCRCPATAPCG